MRMICVDRAYGVQRMIANAEVYCDDWNLRVSLNKYKVMVFRKGGILKINEKWYLKRLRVEVVAYEHVFMSNYVDKVIICKEF